MKISEPCAAGVGAIGELAGQAQLAHRALARDFLFLAAAQALFGALDHEVEQLVGLQRIAGEPMVERIAHRLLDDARGLGGREPVLGLALEFRLADEHREHGGGDRHHVVAGDGAARFSCPMRLGVVAQALEQGGAQTGLVRAAVGRRDRVAIGRDERIGVGARRRPPIPPSRARLSSRCVPEKMSGCTSVAFSMTGGEIILQAAGEVQRALRPDASIALEQLLRAGPADFDAAEQIGLGARHAEQARRIEFRLCRRKSARRA